MKKLNGNGKDLVSENVSALKTIFPEAFAEDKIDFDALRPCPEESVDWDTTQNLFIEGENLEVLSETGRQTTMLRSKKLMNRADLQKKLRLKSQANFRERYLKPALESGLIEMTISDKPKSSRQMYRLTLKGKQTLEIY